MTHIDPPSNLHSKRLSSHVSALERAFGDQEVPVANDPETLAAAEELKKKIMRDREEFIKLYQLAAMNHARSVLLWLSKQWNFPIDIEQDVPAVWSNLVLRLLEGKFTSFQHRGSEGSFRKWLRGVIENECKCHLKEQGRVLGKKGPKSTSALADNIDVECFDPENRTLETTLRRVLIRITYETMKEAGLYGAAVLYWEQRKREINENKEADALSTEGKKKSDEQTEKGLVTDLAAHLTQLNGKTIRPDNAKKYLERGRDLFAKNFIDQIAKYDGMFDGKYDVDRIIETLVELGFLDKQRTSGKGAADTMLGKRLRSILDLLREEEQENNENAKKHPEKVEDLFAKNFIDQIAKLDEKFDGKYDVDRIEETLIELGFLDKPMPSDNGVADNLFSKRLRRILDLLREEEQDDNDDDNALPTSC